jgi:S1/P1 Nuclease
MPRASIFTAAIVLNLTFNLAAIAYGPVGHEIVGAIADERLAGTKTGEQVGELLQGISLKKASVIADEIKGWDKNTPDDPKAFHYSRHPKIDADLTEYWKANPPTKDPNSPVPSHHWFHYSDVPLVRPEKYEDGNAGRSQWDIVHMIAYCVDVLRGRIPEQNERKITKPIAVILLAHFVGDIHQPLHVGAEYFDSAGNVADPDKDKTALADEGGNSLNLEQNDNPLRGRGNHKRKFHVFWDMDTVNALLPQVPDTTAKEERRAAVDSAEQSMVHEMATHEPNNWKVPAGEDVNHYSYDWANEILPIAREAHLRLVFKRVAPMMDEDKLVAAGDVEEKPGSPPGEYRKWATEVVREELHKAGWRLADLLEKSLAEMPAASPNNTSTPSG